MDQVYNKDNALKKYLKELKSVLIAFSGGIDSTFLAKTALDTLGYENILAVTAESSTYPEAELEAAKQAASEIGMRHKIIISEELDIKEFRNNPPNRCYYCKGELFSKLIKIAEAEGLNYVLDGSNHDDTGDFRPGMDAAKELGVISPLVKAGMTKDDIRVLSKESGIKIWDKPSFACLSSRFPYGDKITAKKLKMVEKAEVLLKESGFRQYRVRHHGETARIEIPKSDFNLFLSNTGLMDKIVSNFKDLGFIYVTLDLQGYRAGSMNEKLPSLSSASV